MVTEGAITGRLTLCKPRSEYAKSYLLASAMRGPDTLNQVASMLKGKITARLRALVFTEDECMGLYADWPMNYRGMNELIHCIGNYPVTPLDKGMDHYTKHLLDAMRITERETIWGGYFDNIISVLYSVLECAQSYRKLDHSDIECMLSDVTDRWNEMNEAKKEKPLCVTSQP